MAKYGDFDKKTDYLRFIADPGTSVLSAGRTMEERAERPMYCVSAPVSKRTVNRIEMGEKEILAVTPRNNDTVVVEERLSSKKKSLFRFPFGRGEEKKDNGGPATPGRVEESTLIK
jgi:hypothetical protein